MPSNWESTKLGSVEDVFRTLTELKKRRWLSRGHSQQYEGLWPSIDRPPFAQLNRATKLEMESRSIRTFRSTALFFASEGESAALKNDVIALMVLRHYGVRTRLLDWSMSPFVAAFFAVSSHDNQDGEIWAFSHDDYAREGKLQWRDWPETTSDGSGDDDKFKAELTAFSVTEPPDWIIACWYPEGFPRQNAQSGLYTMTARFGVNHAEKMRALLRSDERCRHLVIPAALKEDLRAALRAEHNIWRGPLYPDSAGAADTAKIEFNGT